ncbi:MAG: NUDIX domain-containing protein, partial [Candidatus Omnitrophica bacterium]|nr:NUDIX domain-containing protein [Candidatus Omnitrophota bacterium]
MLHPLFIFLFLITLLFQDAAFALRPRSSAFSVRKLSDFSPPLTASDGQAKQPEILFLEAVRTLLRSRSVVTPIAGEEDTEIKASSAILLRFYENEWQLFLVKRRQDARRYPGFWVFPTETREREEWGQTQEKPFPAILRGLQEELNLALRPEDALGRIGKYLTVDKKGVISPFLFVLSDEQSQSVKVNPAENERGKWVPISLFLNRPIQQDHFLPE